MSQTEITFVTGNADKVRTANEICNKFGITLVQTTYDIAEIQAEDAEIIAREKASKAYELVGKPVVVNDDSWTIPGLGGFPGPYMKSMNHWLSAEDFLRLTKTLTDRRIILSQYTIYQDKQGAKLFQRDIEGLLLTSIQGDYKVAPHANIVSFDGGKTSIGANLAKQHSNINHLQTTWHDLGEWLAKEQP
jgi:non-canonical purine NTP pyrophosphatase (RdgB/HAM1 family)